MDARSSRTELMCILDLYRRCRRYRCDSAVWPRASLPVLRNMSPAAIWQTLQLLARGSSVVRRAPAAREVPMLFMDTALDVVFSGLTASLLVRTLSPTETSANSGRSRHFLIAQDADVPSGRGHFTAEERHSHGCSTIFVAADGLSINCANEASASPSGRIAIHDRSNGPNSCARSRSAPVKFACV